MNITDQQFAEEMKLNWSENQHSYAPAIVKLCGLALKGLEAEKLTEQRDALLVALNEICYGNSGHLSDQAWPLQLQLIARAAIAAVEGR